MTVSLSEFQQILKSVQPTFTKIMFPKLGKPDTQHLEDVLIAIQEWDDLCESRGLKLKKLKNLALAAQKLTESKDDEMFSNNIMHLQVASLEFLSMFMDLHKAIVSKDIDLGF